MKKNIWDNVYYHLNDPEEIRLAILYAIRYVGVPVSDIELKHFMLSATSVEFLDLLAQIDALLKDNHIKTVERDDGDHYDFTKSGREMIDFFEDKIKVSVRESLRECIDAYYHRQKMESRVKATLIPTEQNAYLLGMRILEGKTTLLEASVFAGDRERAIRLKKNFEANPIDVYTGLVRLLEREQVES